MYPIWWKKRNNIYLLWTKNTQYPIYWFASKYASSLLLAQGLWSTLARFVVIFAATSMVCSLCKTLLNIEFKISTRKVKCKASSTMSSKVMYWCIIRIMTRTWHNIMQCDVVNDLSDDVLVSRLNCPLF